jgi:twitching motility protein PilT
MVSLKNLLSSLEGRRSARLELMSGRRPRLVYEGDARTERGEVKNLADEALTDDEVMSLCEAAGAGRRLETIDAGPVSWTYDRGGQTYRVTAELKGREIAASFAHLAPGQEPPRRNSQSLRAQRRSQASMKPGPRSDRSSKRPSPTSVRAPRPEERRPEIGYGDGRRHEARDADPRGADPRHPASRLHEPSHAEGRHYVEPRHEARSQDARQHDPRLHDPRHGEGKQLDARDPTPRHEEVRRPDARVHEARTHEARTHEARTHEARTHEARTHEARTHEARTHEARTHEARTHEARAEEARPHVARRPTPRPERRPTPASHAAPHVVAPLAPARDASAREAAGAVLTAVRWPQDHGSTQRIGQLLAEGRRAGASDLHLVPQRPAVFRVAGALVPTRESFPAAETERAILALVPEGLRQSFVAKGGVDFALDAPMLGRFRANVTATLRGLKASLRFIPREPPTLASLGLPAQLADATHHHQGLVVVTGPSGHGKTTTLAALVDHINASTTHHIITVEDPVEIVHPRKTALVTQREVGTQTESFARALKGALRQDPDVIVVGELRDTETVRMALMASETGHLVLGTMNTPSAAATIEALIDLFPPGDQPQVRATLAGGLKYIVSQRLVRRSDGSGRAVALETLPGSLPLWNLIREQKTFQLPSLMQRGKGLGVLRLNDSLADLVRQGVADAAEAIAMSDSPDELDAMLKGEPARKEDPERRDDLVGGLLGRAGAFFSRKAGD